MNDVNVLLTAGGGIATTSIIDCLKNNYDKRKVNVICTDVNEQPLLNFKADKFFTIPKGSSKNYIKELLKICKQERIDVMMPQSGPEILVISKNLDIFLSNDVIPTVSDYSSIKTSMDKEKTYSKLSKLGIPIPDFVKVTSFSQFKNASKDLGYPKKDICFKPSKYADSGGTRGFRILRKKNSLQKVILQSKPGSVEIDYSTAENLFKNSKNFRVLLMEYLPGQEFSAYAFGYKGKMSYCVVNIRQKLEQYYSFEAQSIENKKVEEICKSIFEKFNFSYNVNIQLKLSKSGIPKIIEINPRMGGSISLPTASGINLPYFALKMALNEEIKTQTSFRSTKMIRYWKEVFIDESGNIKEL